MPRMANMSSHNKERRPRPQCTARRSVLMLGKRTSSGQGQMPHSEGSSRAVLGIPGRRHQPLAGTTLSQARNHSRPMACHNNLNMANRIYRHLVYNQPTVSRRTVPNKAMNLLPKVIRPQARRV